MTITVTVENIRKLGPWEDGFENVLKFMNGRTEIELTVRNLLIAWYDYDIDIWWYLKKIPREIIIDEILKNHELACGYAEFVDNGPNDDTRKAACEDPYQALKYGVNVEGPHDDTRRSACRRIVTAYDYAFQVDRGPHEDTRTAVYKDSSWKHAYILEFGG